MSKPLELTVYPTFWLSGNLWTTAAAGATISDPVDVDYWVQCKRFTEAELAADYWMVMSGLFDGHGKKARERRATLERFATLPSYDEVA